MKLFKIKWYKPLFLGESIKDKHKWLKYRITYGKRTGGYYLLILPSNSENMMDIIRSDQLAWPCYKKQRTVVIGIAGSKKEAFLLVGDIVDRMYKATGAFDLPDYLGINSD